MPLAHVSWSSFLSTYGRYPEVSCASQVWEFLEADMSASILASTQIQGWPMLFANSTAMLETCLVRSWGPITFIFSETICRIMEPFWNFFRGQHLVSERVLRSSHQTMEERRVHLGGFFWLLLLLLLATATATATSSYQP